MTLTLAEVKRRVVPGVLVRMTYHKRAAQWNPKYPKDREEIIAGNLVRPVQRAQTNAVTFLNEAGQETWLYWPKAAEFRADEPNSFSILEGSTVLMSYEILGGLPQ